MLPLVANLALVVADAVLLRLSRPLAGVVVLPAVAIAAGLPFRSTGSITFATLQCAAWAFFLHLPVLLWLGRQRGPSVALAALGLWAFGIEPRWLEVRTEALPGPGLRVALVADLQTDHVDGHTRAALAAVAAADPDLVLFAGDYLQVREHQAFMREAAALNEALRQLRPRLGAVAVRGDVDHDAWATIFAGLPVRVVERTQSFDLGDLTLTALDPRASREPGASIPAVDGYHLIFGHAPDFALHTGEGELLLAGHTHGGQVRVPGFGPLLTFSAVPRAWAGGGLVDLGGGRHLYVSRGVGLERLDAPRLRLFCRPEITLLDLGDRARPGDLRPVPRPDRAATGDDPVPERVRSGCAATVPGAEPRLEDEVTVRIGGEVRRAGVVSCAAPGTEGPARQYAWITGPDGAADFAGEVGHRDAHTLDWWTDPAVEPVDADGDGQLELMVSGRWERVTEAGAIDADLARALYFPRSPTTAPAPCPWTRLLPERLPHALYVVEDARVREEASGTEGRLRMRLTREGDALRVHEEWEGAGGWTLRHERVAVWDPVGQRLTERCPTRPPPLAHAVE